MNLLSRYFYIPLLIIIVIISQIFLLEPHLKYGFSDVDWGFLSIYKTQNPFSLSQLIDNFKEGGTRGGVYTHQIYYIGIQSEFFGLDFKSFQLTTHLFKILAILAAFPLIWAISGSSVIAFIATILFAFSYSTVGTMYTVVTSSDYSAMFSMGIFATLYWYIVKRNSGNWLLLVALFFLLILTLFLSTERMYQLPLFIGLAEVFFVWQKKKLEKNSLKRIIVMFLPLILIFLIKPTIFLSFLQHGVEIVQGVSAGDWNILLTPFISLGSIVLPNDYVKYLGIVKIESFSAFLDFLISGPLPLLTIVTIAFGACIFKKAHIRIVQILGLTLIFSLFLFTAGSHFVNHLINKESVTQALIGLYILAFAIISLLSWIKQKERLMIGLFAGPFLAFLYIFLIWIGASVVEIFSGAHRYLTIPALFMSLFLGNLLGLVFLRIVNFSKSSIVLKFVAVIPIILVIILFIKVNAKEINGFFISQLYNGFGAEDKQLMRIQLIDLTSKLSTTTPSLIYFDFTQDQGRGYYYDNTLLGGFGSWTLWHPRINFNESIAPKSFWNDTKKLKAAVSSRNGKEGFSIENNFFELENFYAFKLKDRKIYDIKEDILKQLDSNLDNND